MKRKWVPYFCEFLACTFIGFWGLGLIIPFAISGSITTFFEFSILYGLIFAVTIVIFAPLSGAHIDPAFSIFSFLSGQMSLKQLGGYVIVQILGWGLGSGLVYLLNDSLLTDFFCKSGSNPVSVLLCSYPQADTVISFFIEALLTALLVFAVGLLLEPDCPLRPTPALFPVSVGGVITVILVIGGSRTGACINFARDLGARIAAVIYGSIKGYDNSFVFGSKQWILYCFSCIVGAIIGWIMVRFWKKLMILRGVK